MKEGEIIDEGFVFAEPSTTSATTKAKPDLAKHPIRWAYVRVGDFDFTIFSLHLTFDDGEAKSSKEELVHFFDYLRDDYFTNEHSDPDIIISGDFNLPTEDGKALSDRMGEADWMPIETIIAQYPEFSEGQNKLTVLVDAPTSRPNKVPANNYDHFIISEDLRKEEFISASIVAKVIVDETDLDSDKKLSDHYPVIGVFRKSGANVSLDSE